MASTYSYLFNHIVASITKEDSEQLKAYQAYYEEIIDDLRSWAFAILEKHPVFGPAIQSQSPEEFEENDKLLQQLQHDAIYKNEWEPYLEHQINTGIMYARMGVEFYMWQDVTTLIHKYVVPRMIEDDSRSSVEKRAIIKGMLRFLDIAISAIGESYLNEKKAIIERQQEQQEEINRELNRTLKLVKEKNKELEQFVYIASHDLQEPLRMITSFMTQLDNKYSEELDDKARQYINFAVDGASRMRNIILDLLKYSRAGAPGTNFELVDMNHILEDVLSLNKKMIEEKNVIIDYSELPTINAVKVSMHQVWQNLLTNAIKYQKNGVRPEVKIAATETSDHWQFSVADNGIGIEPQYFDKIFILFQRLHSRTEYSGTGIGLSICKKIIEYHNGKIWVESEPGEGCTFHFTISKQL